MFLLGVRRLILGSRLWKTRELINLPLAKEQPKLRGLMMSQSCFFSHQSPDGGFASDRLRERGIQYRILAENIARSMNARAAHRDLMDSPGHRANILRK